MIDRVRQRVSLCMIVRNEARNLADCVQILRPMLSEMIIVDTGSTDGTQQIAHDLGATVIDFEWIDDFSAARNEALRHATGDYILWVDADDRFDAANAAKLHELIRTLDGRPHAHILDILCKTPHGTQAAPMEYQPRLFRADPRIEWQYRVHEQVLPCLQQLGYEVCWPGIRVDHEGYADPELLRQKALRNLRLCRVEYAVAPDDPAVLYHLGKEFVRLGSMREALAYLFKSLQCAQSKDSWVARIYVETVALLNRLGRKAEALQLVREGRSKFSTCARLLLAEAELLCEQGGSAEAMPILRQLLATPTQQPFGLGMPIQSIHSRARNLLGVLHYESQDFDQAEAVFQQAVREDSTSVEALTWLGFVHLARGEMQSVDGVLRRLHRLPNGLPYALCVEAEGLKQYGRLTQALASAQRAAVAAPDMPLPRMLIADMLLLLGGRIEEIRTALVDVLRVAPGHAPALRELERLNQPQANTASWYVNTVIIGEDCCTAT
jgi:glycosyltransferase involved in cell wall biosynthesis